MSAYAKQILREVYAEAKARLNSRDRLADDAVEALGDRIGYGAMMSAAARIWYRKAGTGAFVVGPCYGTLESMFEPRPPAEVGGFDSVAFGEAVAAHRGDLSLRDAAEVTGVSASTLSRIEGGALPDVRTLFALSSWMDRAVSDFASPEADALSGTGLGAERGEAPTP